MTARIIPIDSGRTERHRAGCSSPRPVTTHATATLTQRGYVILYRHGQVNHCPACSKTHWWIGNRSAQCAFCDTALDLQRI
jgi:hypothetical protein